MSGSSARRAYAQPRPTPVGITFAVRQQTRGNQQFQPLPPPTGSAPYHLSLDRVLPADQISAIQSAGRMVLHIVGDTGGVKYPVPQEQQFEGSDTAARPSFFYHLGDVVYYNGEASEYYSQFYEPYSHYSAPIFAIPGNHDGDVMPGGAAVRARRLLRRVTPARVLARSRNADRQLHARSARAPADRHGYSYLRTGIF